MAKRVSLPVTSELADRFERRIRYLRVSLTDRCNYRCTYCMPEEGVALFPRADILTFEEVERVVRVFVGLGVRRVRLTGGEPTIRRRMLDLVGALCAIPGLEIVMTTNGHRLPELAEPLARAGLRGVNVSIDTLDPARFSALTRRGDLARVIGGIDAALAAGLAVKLNAVALRGTNDDELPALCAFGWARGVVPRFIEHMPMSDGALYRPAAHLGAAEIRGRIADHFGGELEPCDPGGVAGPARYWRLRGAPARQFGIISAMSEHFCATCNRVRLSATGQLHTCLAYDDAVDLRRVLRSGGSDQDLRAAISAAVAGKREGHEFGRTGVGAPHKHMVSIGG